MESNNMGNILKKLLRFTLIAIFLGLGTIVNIILIYRGYHIHMKAKEADRCATTIMEKNKHLKGELQDLYNNKEINACKCTIFEGHKHDL